jgi:2,3-bisphosphoglycerate-dependent phosphoglycerate mutase
MISESRLVLVRHGESTWNALRLVQGQDDRATLTPRGRQQATEVARNLSSQDFELIVSSDLQRAMATASVIAEALDLEVVSEPSLRERGFGVAEGGPLDRLTERMVGIKDGVVTDEEASPEGGETLRDFRNRVGTFFELRQRRWPTKRLLVVTHGGTIRALRSYSAGTPFQGSQWNPVDNGTVWTVSIPLS